MSKVDIIVPTCGQTEFTRRCLKSVRRHTGRCRLIWVDNGSQKASRRAVMEELQGLPEHVAVWSGDRLGFVGATNLGLRLSLSKLDGGAEYVAFLNNDVEVTSGWLDRMSSVLDREPTIHAIGPVTSECQSWQSFSNVGKVVPVFQIPAGFEALGTDARADKLGYCYGDLWKPCHMLAFFCTLFRRSVFEKVGMLDAGFGDGLGDDDDLCKRMRDAGMLCALSLGTYVFHNHRTTFSGLYDDKALDDLSEKHHRLYEQKHGERASVVQIRG